MILPPPPARLLDGAALFMDFDGTLVEIADTPGAIVVPPSLPRLFARLTKRLQGRVAVISGRSLADLDLYLPVPGLAKSGSHGVELRTTAGMRAVDPHPMLGLARTRLERFAARDAGLMVEDKPSGLALHYRLAPQHGAAARALVAELAKETGLAVQHGHMVAELRPAGFDKGHALRALMAEPPFAGARPVFIGDDQTDEHAFRASDALGGAGVLVRESRDTAARYFLPSVTAVREWLEAYADA